MRGVGEKRTSKVHLSDSHLYQRGVHGEDGSSGPFPVASVDDGDFPTTATLRPLRLIQLSLSRGHPHTEFHFLGRRVHSGYNFGVRVNRHAGFCLQANAGGIRSSEFMLRGASGAGVGVQFDSGEVVLASGTARVGAGAMVPSTSAEPGG